MFKRDVASPYTGLSQQGEEPETAIGESVAVTGTIRFERLLRIDGSFEGELISEGKLIIGPKGTVKADLDLDEVFISGKLEGNITVKTRVVLRGRAEVKGNITAPLISIDEGVTITGELKIASFQQQSSGYVDLTGEADL